MESTIDFARYVVRYQPHLLTEAERFALSHLIATMKATGGMSDLKAQEDAQSSWQATRSLSNDPEVLSLAANGYEALLKQVGSRLLTERHSRLSLNRCPECGGLARTPAARQCRFCGHDWHK